MTPESTSFPRHREASSRKNEAPQRKAADGRADAAKRDDAARVVTRPEDDKYFDPPCTD